MKKRTMRWLVGSSLAAATGIVMLFWISSLLQTFRASQKEYRAASLPPELRAQLDSLKGNAHTIRETVGAAGGILRRLGTGGALPPESVAAIEARLRETAATPSPSADIRR